MMIGHHGAGAFGRLTDIALSHKLVRPDAPAYIWLRAGEKMAGCLSFAALYDQAADIASVLAARGRGAERILLMYPPTGLDFIPAFLGCLLAGAVPVPAYKPSAHRDKADRLEAIVNSAQANVIMSTPQGFEESGRALAASPILSALDRVATSIDAAPQGTAGLPINTGSTAFLQYTSGSTAAPKGVVVTHDNLAHNARIIADTCECNAASVFLTWLPLFHDLGLIGNVMQSLRFGVPCYVMSPASFLQRPGRWVEAMSRFGVTNAAAPNFAYDLCAQKHEMQPGAPLDLRSVRVLLNGAEKVQHETLQSFNRVFGAYGLCPRALRPAYGLAEATLVVSMAAPQRGGDGVLSADTQALEAGRMQHASSGERSNSLVSAGCVRGGQEVAIVEPDTALRCAPDQVGEIWLRGGSVCAGYWANEAATRETFGAIISGESGTWLRTGDLGLIHDHQLIVTGRRKELIILHGRNHYPQDIEAIVQAVSASLRRDGGAAFSVETSQGEALVIVQEVERTALRQADPVLLTIEIRRALWEAAQIGLHDLVLVRPGSVPKTSSGKIQRGVARARYLAGDLPELDTKTGAQARTQLPQPDQDQQADQLIGWIRDYAQTRINSRLMDERRSMPPSLVLDFGNVGLLGMQAPRAFGGLGMADSGFLRVVEQLGAIDQTLALFVTLNNVLGIRPIARYGSAAVRDRHLPLLATGRELGAFALTEPGAGSNPLAMQSTAAPVPGGFTLSGGKIWSGSAAWAGVVNVFVRQLSPEGHGLGISGFAVAQGTPGLVQGPEAMTMGMRAMVQNGITLDRLRVDATALLGRELDGMAVAQDAMAAGRVAIGAMCLGGIKRCLQLMLRYAGRRSVSTGRLAENPAFRAEATRLAIMAQAVEASLALASRLSASSGFVPLDLAAAIKVTAPEMFWTAADALVQFLGGRGYIEGNLAPQILRDARVLRIFEGPTETMRAHLGARLLHGTSDIPALLAAAAPAALRVLDTARDRLGALPGIYRQRGEDEVAAQRMAGAVLGEIASQAILLGALMADRGDARAVAWFAQRIEDATADALAKGKALAAPLQASEIAALVDGFAGAIGDLEQGEAADDAAPDILLRRAGAGGVHETRGVAPAKPEEAPAIVRDIPTHDVSDKVLPVLQSHLRRALGLRDHSRLGREASFAELGLDSVSSVSLAFDLEDAFAIKLDPTCFWVFITVAQLAAEIGRLRARFGHAPAPPVASVPDAGVGAGLDVDALSDTEAERLLLEVVGAGS